MNLLLVEGTNDARIVKAICDKSGFSGVHILPLIGKDGGNLGPIASYNEKYSQVIASGDLFSFGIYPAGGDDNLIKMISPILKNDQTVNVLAFILDVDIDKIKDKSDSINIKSRLQQIENKFNQYKKELKDIDSNGLVISKIDDLPKIGLWLMPDNTRRGMLEDFLMDMVTLPDEGMELAQTCVVCAIDEGCTSFKKTHFSKAVIHTYLSWQHEPGDALALSITQGKLDINSPIAIKFIQWLKTVFDIQTKLPNVVIDSNPI